MSSLIPENQSGESPCQMIRNKTSKPQPLLLSSSITELDDDQLYELVKTKSEGSFFEQPKDLQMQTVASLVRRQHSFVLAGTGYGKSRIPKMYYKLFPTIQKPVTLVLNPLDSLGDKQVREKNEANISAINLTQSKLNAKEEQKIIRGDYSFVYLSPEVFLNSEIFTRIFFNAEFQARLILMVVDEAHMIYMWGLVASGESKELNSHGKHQDIAVFQPSYGEISERLMATYQVPILLLSETCCLQAVDAILKSLKIKHEDMHVFRGKLTRNEITIWQIPMKHSLASCDDLLQLFGPESCIKDDELVPTIIYSTTRNLTMQVMAVLNDGRRVPQGHYNPKSTCVRRFHAVTGELDKIDVVTDFANGAFPVISSTMALGMGQNWKRVRHVVHFGRGDPATLFQMIGRCGRGGDRGLGILFVESDDDRMDALAITPVCLRICFSIDNLLGYIPLSAEDPNVIREAKRERKEFDKCDCSNCLPISLIAQGNLIHITKANFDQFMNNPEGLAPIADNTPFTRVKAPSKAQIDAEGPLTTQLEDFAIHLVERFKSFYASKIDMNTSYLTGEDFLTIWRARALVIGCETNQPMEILDRLMGSKIIDGQFDFLCSCIEEYLLGGSYQGHLKLRREELNTMCIKNNREKLLKELKKIL
ncbi:hypothetical protein PTTG_28114 [Puccinia triticina 1-1 BBBD Race 1]|uniref:DNA 3'-5' helicase n=1 Tax=Puccinia triticina (isolate 1-1 / race 1 (BBBD)) TaxID=630390 RepID=A0A180GF44_PUCT1|nr:hypothetical protein PTTG_28114 [Puccinia triticina 1-1 BBBD Race 1]